MRGMVVVALVCLAPLVSAQWHQEVTLHLVEGPVVDYANSTGDAVRPGERASVHLRHAVEFPGGSVCVGKSYQVTHSLLGAPSGIVGTVNPNTETITFHGTHPTDNFASTQPRRVQLSSVNVDLRVARNFTSNESAVALTLASHLMGPSGTVPTDGCTARVNHGGAVRAAIALGIDAAPPPPPHDDPSTMEPSEVPGPGALAGLAALAAVVGRRRRRS